MAGQKRLNYYDARVVFVASQDISADFNSDNVDLRKYDNGIVKVEWSGYDGTTGIARLQISDENSTSDSKFGNWGGETGAFEMNEATGTAVWELDEVPPCWMRLRIELGDGTEATITASYILAS